MLLPPANANSDDLVEQGFVAAVRERGIAVDIVLAGISAEMVMQKIAVPTLRDEVIAPARERGYRDIWLAGISLGAFNALHYLAESDSVESDRAATYADAVAGLVLLEPYPGTGDILHEIETAGGVAAWAQAHPASAHERIWWHWLWQQSRAGKDAKPVYIGLGAGDRFSRGQRLLTSVVAPERVDVIEGDHSWPVWQQLWQRWLDRGVLATHARAGRK